MDRPDENTSPHRNGRPGPLGERFVAHVIDGIILFFPLLLLWAIGIRDLPFAFATLTVNLLSLAYFVTMESTRGRTIGKQIRGLRVRNQFGTVPTVKQALFRNMYLLLAIVPGIVGSVLSFGVVAWIAFTISQDNLQRQGIHDRMANKTFVTQDDPK